MAAPRLTGFDRQTPLEDANGFRFLLVLLSRAKSGAWSRAWNSRQDATKNAGSERKSVINDAMNSIYLTSIYFSDRVQNMDSNLSSIKEKWGSTLDAGFVVVPTILLKRQADLELNAQEVVILLHLIAAWWRADDLPYPRTATIAHRAGMSARTVQRHLRDLENKGFIRRLLNQPANGRDDLTVTRYDLHGLVEKMRTLPVAATAAEILAERPISASPEQPAPNLAFLKV